MSSNGRPLLLQGLPFSWVCDVAGGIKGAKKMVFVFWKPLLSSRIKAGEPKQTIQTQKQLHLLFTPGKLKGGLTELYCQSIDTRHRTKEDTHWWSSNLLDVLNRAKVLWSPQGYRP